MGNSERPKSIIGGVTWKTVTWPNSLIATLPTTSQRPRRRSEFSKLSSAMRKTSPIAATIHRPLKVIVQFGEAMPVDPSSHRRGDDEFTAQLKGRLTSMLA